MMFHDDFLDNDVLEDDFDVMDIIRVGVPRRLFVRSEPLYYLDELSFYKRFRLTKNTVLLVLPQIEEQLEFTHNLNNSVSPINQLLMTLRCYATGTHLMTIADFGGMHESTVCRIVKKVTEVLAGLRQRYIIFPSFHAQKLQAQRDFFDIAAFPQVVGAVDGTHIKIQSPGGEDPEIFRNRKSYFSVNVQAVSSAKMKFISLVARWPGSAHDATIFNSSNLRGHFENGNYPNSLLLGDSAYNIRPYLLTPLQNPVTNSERLYNESHIRTRGAVEKLFGIWKRRFPILAYGCRLKLETTLAIIVATAVLHNIARDQSDEAEIPPFENELQEHGLDQLINNGEIPNLPLPNNNNNVAARTTLINNYFARL